MSTVYRSQVAVTQVDPYHYLITSVPYPLHRAEVRAEAREGHVYRWAAVMLSGPYPRHLGRWRLEVALSHAAEKVGLLAGQELKERFHGIQRTAMGQGLCPYLGRSLCRVKAEPGTVWCDRHPEGRKATDETL